VQVGLYGCDDIASLYLSLSCRQTAFATTTTMAETLRRSKRLSLKAPQRQTHPDSESASISSAVTRSSPLKGEALENATRDSYDDSLLLTPSDEESDVNEEESDVYTPRETSTSSRTNSTGHPPKRKKRSTAPAYFQRMKDRQEKMKGLPFTSFPLDVVFEVCTYTIITT
jgi:hypothetical protein